MNLLRFGVLSFLLLISSTLLAGNENQPAGARRSGLGMAYAGIRGDFWQLFMNPAGMAGLDAPQAGAYFEQRFLLSELNYGTAGFVYPFKARHWVGLDFSGFGFGGYNEARIGAAYATTLFEKLSLGAKVNYSRTSIENYGAAGALFLDLGVSVEVVEGLSLGARVFNANQADLDSEIGEQIPTTLDIGGAYQVTDRVLFVVDVQKQVNFPVSLRGGIEYGVLDFLQVRAGVSTEPVTLNFGLGLNYKGVQFDFSNQLHEYLGYTPSISLSYRFKSSK